LVGRQPPPRFSSQRREGLARALAFLAGKEVERLGAQQLLFQGAQVLCSCSGIAVLRPERVA
jgi:hypothetical protein